MKAAVCVRLLGDIARHFPTSQEEVTLAISPVRVTLKNYYEEECGEKSLTTTHTCTDTERRCEHMMVHSGAAHLYRAVPECSGLRANPECLRYHLADGAALLALHA